MGFFDWLALGVFLFCLYVVYHLATWAPEETVAVLW